MVIWGDWLSEAAAVNLPRVIASHGGDFAGQPGHSESSLASQELQPRRYPTAVLTLNRPSLNLGHIRLAKSSDARYLALLFGMLKSGHKIARVRWSAWRLGEVTFIAIKATRTSPLNEDGKDFVGAAPPDWHEHDEPH